MGPPAEDSRLSRQRSAVPSVLEVIKMMQETASAEEQPSSPRSVARSPPPVARTPSQHSALQPPRFNLQQQQQAGELGDLRGTPRRSADGMAGGLLRRASSMGGSSAAAGLVHQPYSDKPSPDSARMAKRCTKVLAVLERLKRPGARLGSDFKEALPAAALRTCKVRAMKQTRLPWRLLLRG